ncbi:MAG: addiction module protein [Desulfobacterales bacterium]|nr:addiction module protein [Desulfobacterales bacterium]
MSNHFETVENQVLSLSVEEKFMLTESLIRSLSEYDSGETETLWMAEVIKRYKEIREGRANTISGEEVMAEMDLLVAT